VHRLRGSVALPWMVSRFRGLGYVDGFLWFFSEESDVAVAGVLVQGDDAHAAELEDGEEGADDFYFAFADVYEVFPFDAFLHVEYGLDVVDFFVDAGFFFFHGVELVVFEVFEDILEGLAEVEEGRVNVFGVGIGAEFLFAGSGVSGEPV